MLGVLGGVAPVPFVALGPGPTFDTLGEIEGTAVIDIEGEPTFPTTGQLNMTTVSVIDGVTLFGALGFWVSGRNALVPREEVFPPRLSEAEVKQRNARLFEASETTAETAALRYLDYPSTVIAEGVSETGAASGVLQPGDELIRVDGRPVDTAQQVIGALRGRTPGERVDLTFRRGDAPVQTLTITLGPGQQPGRGYLGITVASQPEVDFDITISLADVGGPSAGLMFALSIVDKLTPGALADGTFIAGTGTITSAGKVGPIGGIAFKMQRAREAGGTVFLVPAGNCAEAVRRAPDGLQLVRAGTLDQAVRALEALGAGQPAPRC
ncbi:MAG: PDZ domain-containing protein [Pseudonocardiaceae bacterium]|nr:PDZ domain-containing protein [Pseudonocardiaceae bacterium]